MTAATRRPAMRRRSSVVVVALVAAALVSLTACVPQQRPRPAPTGLAKPQSVVPLVPLVSSRVLAYCPKEDAVHVRGYLLAVDEVYICRGGGSRATDGVSTYGPWEAAYRIDHPEQLLRAYAAPDAHEGPKVCHQFPSDPLIIWVHHDGVTTAFYAPVDACGSPITSAANAYQKAKRTLLVEVDRGAPSPSQKDVKG
jgi:hypothetical protein